MQALFVEADICMCAIPLAQVHEICRPLPTVPISGAPAFVLGATVFRGAPTPVIELTHLIFGRSARPATRFVSLRVGERAGIVAVEHVQGVRALAPSTFSELPPLLRSTVLEALSALDLQLVLALESSRVVPDDIWEKLDARGSE